MVTVEVEAVVGVEDDECVFQNLRSHGEDAQIVRSGERRCRRAGKEGSDPEFEVQDHVNCGRRAAARLSNAIEGSMSPLWGK